MNTKKVGYGVIIGTGLLVAGLVLCPGKKEKLEQQVDVQPPVQTTQPVQKIQLPQQRKYTVKKGDYLSGIVYNELGLRGKKIYEKCLEIQADNNFGPERDISKVVNGKLVSGKDGFVDLIYPGERITLD